MVDRKDDKSVRAKMLKADGGEEFVSEVEGLSVEQLEKRLSDLAKGLESNARAKNDDTGLEDARATVRELSGPYNDTAKAVRLRTKFVIELIGVKGGKID